MENEGRAERKMGKGGNDGRGGKKGRKRLNDEPKEDEREGRKREEKKGEII